MSFDGVILRLPNSIMKNYMSQEEVIDLAIYRLTHGGWEE